MMTESALPGFEVLGESAHLMLVQRDGWSFVKRQNNVDVVAIVAVTADRKLILVEQYRPPVNANVIELPAGLVGDEQDPDEALQQAAERELLEETGYSANTWIELANVTSSAGLTDETVTIFRATELTRVTQGGGVDNEQITVHEIPLESADDWLNSRSKLGNLIDGRVYAALFWAASKLGQ